MFRIGQAVRTNWGAGTIVFLDKDFVVVDVWGAGHHSMRIDQIEDFPLSNRYV